MSDRAGAPLRRIGSGLAGAALMVAVVTLVARATGFLRQLIFQANVGPTELGDVYTTANYLPNILFEIAAGGALASAVVPVIAGAAARGEVSYVRRTAGALLGWTLLLLIPVAAVGALLARPLMSLLLGPGADPAALDTGTRMLLVFMPQIPLYGLAVVTAGVMQAHRRFFAPAVAPVVSSLVVASAYLAFGAMFTGSRDDLSTLDRNSELVLSVGTTLGVLALALVTLLPMVVIGVRAWPSLRFPTGVARKVGALALAGISAVVAQQVAMLLVVRLANVEGGTGGLVTYQNSWMVYLLPYAVLAVPIATSAFPRLAQYADAAADESYAATASASTRAVIAAAGLGAAALVAAAEPIAVFFSQIAPDEVAVPPEHMARALVAFAPGLFGYGLLAHLARVLYARHRGRAAATATVAGWSVVATCSVVFAIAAPTGWTVAALGLANAVGMTVTGGLLLRALRVSAGPAALHRVGGAVLGSVTAAVVGGLLGALVAAVLPDGGVGVTVAVGSLAGLTGMIGFVLVLSATNRAEVRALVARGRAG